MADRFSIRHGASAPTVDDLVAFELGYSTSTGKLYIKVPDSNSTGKYKVVDIGITLSQLISSTSHSTNEAPSADAVYNYTTSTFFPLSGGTITGTTIFQQQTE